MSPRNKGRAAFTLVELLVVIGIMAVLATISVAGYSAASRGMADRGVIQTTASILRIAKQTCQIDRVPTKVLFFNRRTSGDSGGGDATLFQGTAIAIKQMGRITIHDGTYLIDEFADWQQSYPMVEPDKLKQDDSPGMRIYRMRYADRGENKNIDSCSTKVKPFVTYRELADYMIEAGTTIDQWCGNHGRTWSDNSSDGSSVKNGNNFVWGFMASKDNSGLGAGDWEVGEAYGVEIARIDLPKGYIFGNSPPNKDVLEAASVNAVYFDPSSGLEPQPSDDVPVYAMRRSGNTYTPRSVDKVDKNMLKDD